MVYDNSRSSIIQMEKLRRHEQLVEDMRDIFLTGKTRDINFRLRQLQNLLRLYKENWERIYYALHKDLRKPVGEGKIFEHSFLIGDVKLAIKNLKKWTKAQTLPICVANVTEKAWYRYEPFGTVLIIGPLNYPLMLAFMRLCAAIAAGNCAVIKPSELSPRSAALIAELVPKYLDKTCFKVRSADEAIAFINRRPKPLAIYVLTTNSNVSKRFIKLTNSGSIAVNDCMYQSSLHDLPFGGVGDSGIGQYHGIFGFQTFSRPRTVMERSYSVIENWTAHKFRHPPYLNFNIRLMSWIVERFDIMFLNPWPYIPYLIMFVLGMLVMFAFQRTYPF